MRLILAALLIASVVAPDNFFYDHWGMVILYRTVDACYVRDVTPDEQAMVHDHEWFMAFQDQIRADVAAGYYEELPYTEHTDFETHHCQERLVYKMVYNATAV